MCVERGEAYEHTGPLDGCNWVCQGHVRYAVTVSESMCPQFDLTVRSWSSLRRWTKQETEGEMDPLT